MALLNTADALKVGGATVAKVYVGSAQVWPTGGGGGGGSVTFVSASASNDRLSLGNRTLALPTGIAVGDMLLAVAETTHSRTFTTPPGWTSIFARTSTAGDGPSVAFCYKVVTADDIGTSVTWTAPGGGATNVGIAAYRGAAPIPHTWASFHQTDPATTLHSATVTTSAVNARVVTMFARDVAPGSGVGARAIIPDAPVPDRLGGVMGTALTDEEYAAPGVTVERTATVVGGNTYPTTALTVALIGA